MSTTLDDRERHLSLWLKRIGYLLYKSSAGEGYGIGPDDGFGMPTTIGWNYDMDLDDVAGWIENALVIEGRA